jgi:phospholipid/cholesterol/gamma-HCH transport system substrate-binding protein
MKRIIAAVAVVVVGGVGLFLAVWARPAHIPPQHTLILHAYFADAQGVVPGADVRIAGVRVGSVTSVKVDPEHRQAPAAVEMTLTTPYDLRLPSDATASITTAGILGAPYIYLEFEHATGPPILSGAVLRTHEPRLLPADLKRKLDCMADAASSAIHAALR